jgi:hypothetical protein
MATINTGGTDRRQRPRTSSERINDLSETYLRNDAGLKFARKELEADNVEGATTALDAVIDTLPGLWDLRADYLAELRHELDELRGGLT